MSQTPETPETVISGLAPRVNDIDRWLFPGVLICRSVNSPIYDPKQKCPFASRVGRMLYEQAQQGTDLVELLSESGAKCSPSGTKFVCRATREVVRTVQMPLSDRPLRRIGERVQLKILTPARPGSAEDIDLRIERHTRVLD